MKLFFFFFGFFLLSGYCTCVHVTERCEFSLNRILEYITVIYVVLVKTGRTRHIVSLGGKFFVGIINHIIQSGLDVYYNERV